jgi:hypothetical protein
MPFLADRSKEPSGKVTKPLQIHAQPLVDRSWAWL